MVIYYITCPTCEHVSIRAQHRQQWTGFGDGTSMMNILRKSKHELKSAGNRVCPSCIRKHQIDAMQEMQACLDKPPMA